MEYGTTRRSASPWRSVFSGCLFICRTKRSILLLPLILCLSAIPVNANPLLGPNDGSSQISELVTKARVEFENRLADYPSARFRDVTAHYTDYSGDRHFYLCGFVNSKNPFGGYAGWKPFVIMEIPPSFALSLSLYEWEPLDAQLFLDTCDEAKGRKLRDYSGILSYSNPHSIK